MIYHNIIKPKIVFFGTSVFAIPALTALVDEGYEVIVITASDAPAGRKQMLASPPVKLTAEKLGLKILQPDNLKALGLLAYQLIGLSAPLGIVASYGKIIPKEIIELFPKGLLNIHPSLLPKYRGPSPIQYTLLNGESETGVTIIKIDEQVDHGPIVAQSEKRKTQNKNFKELHDELAKLGAELLIKILPDYLAGKIIPRPQDDRQVTFSKKITKADGRVDWHRDARAIYNQFRAFNLWPGIYTIWHDKTLKILDCRLYEEQEYHAHEEQYIGQLWQENGHLFVPCQPGYLEILCLQLAGGKPLTANEFLNGYGKLIRSMV